MTLRARRHLSDVDPAMAALIRRVGACGLKTEEREPYESLVRAISHQQLHGNAARAIMARFLALYPGSSFPSPEMVLATEDAVLRGCGLSGTKVATIRGIAAASLDGVVPTRRAASRLSDTELIERLTGTAGLSGSAGAAA